MEFGHPKEQGAIKISDPGVEITVGMGLSSWRELSSLPSVFE
jgi:hypothetical protein